MRRVIGHVLLPVDAPTTTARLVVVELRDVSRLDAPSRVLATWRRADVELSPQRSIDFRLDAPEAPAGASLSMRVHVDLDGSGAVSRGDLITTTSQPVPVAGDHGPMALAVSRV